MVSTRPDWWPNRQHQQPEWLHRELQRDLGGTAKVTMTGATYDISGTADGFKTDNPSFRTGGTFAIKVSC